MSWAQLTVADCFEEGIGTPMDLFKAVGWYAHAAERGSEEVQKKFQTIYYSNYFADNNGNQRWFRFEEKEFNK